MTCVVGVVGPKGVLLAGDSQGSLWNSNRKIREPKVFSLDETLAVAYCGSFRLGQVLKYHVSEGLDPPPVGMDEMRWAVRDFVPYLRAVTEAHGHLHIHHNVEYLGEAAFLLAIRGRLFCVEEDMQVLEHELPFEALGSGEATAIGAMSNAVGAVGDEVPDSKLEKVALAGIEAATEFTNFVGGRVNSVKTQRWTTAEKALARKILKG